MNLLNRFLVLLPLLTGAAALKAQILEPATWRHGISKEEVKVGEETELIFTATIEPKWYLYSSDFDPDLGPLVAVFNFEENDAYELVGDIRAIDSKKGYDSIFGGYYTYFKGKGEFRQTVKILKANPVIRGSYEYQVCSDIDGRCINFEEDFQFDQVKVSGVVKGEKPEKTQPEPAPADKTTDASLEEKPVETSGEQLSGQRTENSGNQPEEIQKSAPPQNMAKADAEKPRDAYSLLVFMLLAFVGGIGAVMTPCVYPMIPMTVAFFTKDTGKNKTFAILYGISIIFIFTVIGIGITLIFGGDVWNKIATDPVINIFFFLVFFVFALSFFGLFDITLPSRFVNNIDKKADRAGFIGVFFMALTLVVVSFSCTAPIASLILIESTQGAIIRPAVGMFGFSLAFAIPFTLFAIFPGWLNNLPKSGGWLNSVKVVIGFIELALGLKFLMIADQVYHWGLLDRDVYLSIWIIIFTLMGFYILGKIRLPHDSKVERISIPRLLLAIVIFSFVVYLIPGLFGAPLTRLAGFIPPITSQQFRLGEERAGAFTAANNQANELCDEPKYAEKFNLPFGLQGYFDYEQALNCARESNKPLFIDFTGHGCANCWEMEEKVWSKPQVQELLNEYVIVSLYVDDRTELPDSLWYKSDYDGKIKKTIGKQNADLQISRYRNNAQPYYVLLGENEEMLTEGYGYNLDVEDYVAFLKTGLKEFKKNTGSAEVVAAR